MDVFDVSLQMILSSEGGRAAFDLAYKRSVGVVVALSSLLVHLSDMFLEVLEGRQGLGAALKGARKLLAIVEGADVRG